MASKHDLTPLLELNFYILKDILKYIGKCQQSLLKLKN